MAVLFISMTRQLFQDGLITWRHNDQYPAHIRARRSMLIKSLHEPKYNLILLDLKRLRIFSPTFHKLFTLTAAWQRNPRKLHLQCYCYSQILVDIWVFTPKL